ncbi:MAG: response regulator [Deltaproteobacteria bacterium]|nr:MAG: response regulator [Deltaproteobacteria bacterium]TMQ20024.1 MAG: response regulator [Deltaproteobacteria bacterium]
MTDRERRLEVACRLADALVGVAPDLVEELELPTAVLDVAERTARIVNAAWRALFGTRDAYAVIAGVDEVGRTGVGIDHAELALELDGRPAYCAATLRASRDERGATTRVIVVCADITDEVIARQLAVEADVLVWSGPCGGDADYGNRRWSTYVERGSGWQRAVHRDDAVKCNTALTWAVHESGSTDIDARLRRVDGEYRWHRVRFAIASSGSRWFGTASDIHELRQAAAERHDLLARERAARADAERANRFKDQFLVVVSHELRAPLTAMLLWGGVLRDGSADAELRAKAHDAILNSALVQSRVVGDLLDISRAIAGQLHVDLRPVEVEALVRGALDAFAPTALAKQIVLDRRGKIIGGEVLGDAVRLHQVLVNLLANAVKLTDPGGRITVRVTRRGGEIAIEVTDSGRGVAPELLSRMFEPFSQTGDFVLQGDQGLGLGLAIAKQLVELHHGTIEALSAGTGCGTTLTVVLPAAVARHITTPSRGAPCALGLDRVRVLVVDDDLRVRDALALLLGRAGAVVDTAESAAMARTRIAHGAPEVVVCDIAMAVEDGYSFIRGLRASGADIAAIALTAHATETDVGRALAAGFDRHLAKPIELEHLVANIAELVVARRVRSVKPAG